MPRIRSIKPEFFLDEDVAALDPLDRLAFIGLWCVADRAGRLEDRPTRLAIQILPYDRGDFGKRLEHLAEARFIVRYRDETGRQLIQIRTWDRHQRPHHTEQASDLPPYNGEQPDLSLHNGGDTVPTPVEHGGATDGKEKGKEKGKERERGAACSPRVEAPTETEWLDYAGTTWPNWPKSDALAALGYYEARRWTGVKDWHGCAKTCYHRWAGNGKGSNGRRPPRPSFIDAGRHLEPTAEDLERARLDLEEARMEHGS